MSYDPLAPLKLVEMQKWFAGVITRPLIECDLPEPLDPKEAAGRVLPSPTLLPHQRMEIYNQQYWWRLLKTMQDSFPLLVRLFGYYDFNRIIAAPYLLAYPPVHYSLFFLGRHLLNWIEKNYYEEDKVLILHAASLDHAFNHSFIANEHTPLALALFQDEKLEELLNKPLYLQPHIYIFQMDFDLFTFREIMLENEVEYWEKNLFPDLERKKEGFWVLYRNRRNFVVYRKINEGEFWLLRSLQKGATLDAACRDLARHCIDAAEHLQKWFQEWTSARWLTLEAVECS